MSRKLFFSRKFFLFNLIAVGVIAGFTLSFIVFGCSSELSPGETARAQEQSATAQDSSEGSTKIGGTPKQLQSSFHDVAESVLPTVVELKVTQVVERPSPQQFWPFGFGQEDNGNNGNNGNGSEGRQFERQGLGSGVIVRSNGNTYYVLTNAHVVGDADEITVVMHDKTEYQADLVGKDSRLDLAMVKFQTGDDVPVASLGNSEEMRVGDWVLAMGSPFGFVSSVTAGIVSAKGRTGPSQTIGEFIQTDAAINRGNSGGPLVNLAGEVIGINTWIAAPSGGNVGLGFALPINTARKAIDDFIEHGEVQYGWLGVSISDLPNEIARRLDLEDETGAFVHNVYIDSPADKAGLRPGDFIVKINGRKVSGHKEVVRVVGSFREGEEASFTVIRFGERRQVTAEITRRKDPEQLREQVNRLWPGMSIVPLTKEIRSQLELDSSVQGVLVAGVQEGTKAYGVGLRRGVVITEINGTDIDSIKDFYITIGDPETDSFSISYVRQGDTYSTKLNR
jgi:Do/DeqQ family serine protease